MKQKQHRWQLWWNLGREDLICNLSRCIHFKPTTMSTETKTLPLPEPFQYGMALKTCLECKRTAPIHDTCMWMTPEAEVCTDCMYHECEGCGTFRLKADVTAGIECPECPAHEAMWAAHEAATQAPGYQPPPPPPVLPPPAHYAALPLPAPLPGPQAPPTIAEMVAAGFMPPP